MTSRHSRPVGACGSARGWRTQGPFLSCSLLVSTTVTCRRPSMFPGVAKTAGTHKELEVMHLTFIHGIEKFTLLDHYFFICLAEYLDRNSDPLDITYGFYTVALLIAAGVFAFISSDKLKLLEKKHHRIVRGGFMIIHYALSNCPRRRSVSGSPQTANHGHAPHNPSHSPPRTHWEYRTPNQTAQP